MTLRACADRSLRSALCSSPPLPPRAMSLISSLPTVPDADEPPPLGDAATEAEVCDVKHAAAAEDASSSSVSDPPADESACSVASLRKYYDECAFFYDDAPEGEENTYICVDRVTSSLLAAQHRLAHSEFESTTTPSSPMGAEQSLGHGEFEAATTPSSPMALEHRLGHGKFEATATSDHADAEPVSSSSVQTTPVRGALEKLFVTPAPLVPVSVLSSMLDREVESPLSAGPQSPASASASHTPSPCASPDPLLCRPAITDPSSSPSAADSPRSSTVSMLSSSPVSSLEPSSPRSINDSLASSAPPAPLKILDLGVGTGLASRPLFSALSTPRLRVARSSTEGESRVVVPEGTIIPEIWGVDLSPNMLKVSSVLPFAHLIAADLNTSLSNPLENPGSPLAVPGSQGYFDCALSVGTLEFVRDHAFFLAQVRGFLRVGGLFCGTFPSNKSQTVSNSQQHATRQARTRSSDPAAAVRKPHSGAMRLSLLSLCLPPFSLRFFSLAQYPDMSFTTVAQLVEHARVSGGMEVLEVQQYRGWSVSSSEHVEYIQMLAQKRR